MLQWISAHIGTILICLALAAIVILILRSLIRQKKQGKSSCGCNCAHCAMHGSGSFCKEKYRKTAAVPILERIRQGAAAACFLQRG